jgi:hypothetical protein
MVGYGIVRLVERRDDSDTIKFVFVRWIGEGIHRMLRARLGTHSGAIKGNKKTKNLFLFFSFCFLHLTLYFSHEDVISPYHVNVEATTKDEINEDIIWSHVKKASGTATYVVDKPGSAPSVCFPLPFLSPLSPFSSPRPPSRRSTRALSHCTSHLSSLSLSLDLSSLPHITILPLSLSLSLSLPLSLSPLSIYTFSRTPSSPLISA